MDGTVFLTVVTGTVTFVLGQLIVKLVIEPVQDMKKTIGEIAHSLIERANVISNPGVLSTEVMASTSQELRKLSSKLQSHLFLVPRYHLVARVFQLPSNANVTKASGMLIGLSNSLHRSDDRVYDANAKRVESIHDLLGIYMAEEDRQ